METDRRIEALLEKYWQAETDEAEEAEIRDYFASNPGLANHPAAPLFNYFREEQQVGISDRLVENFDPVADKKIRVMKWWDPLLRVAAVLLITGSLIFIFMSAPKPVVMASKEDTYQDPEKAYLETRNALMLISHKLSIGKGGMAEINKINKAEELINTNTDKK
ncbi:MAG TPA: hypothetical protein VK618_03320 [Flavitalea sp.]|nr:hypothetical protein [Flavitalea sp.]